MPEYLELAGLQLADLANPAKFNAAKVMMYSRVAKSTVGDSIADPPSQPIS